MFKNVGFLFRKVDKTSAFCQQYITPLVFDLPQCLPSNKDCLIKKINCPI
jgi:hypothetical protein